MKVIDLLNKIANGEIEDGQRFTVHFKNGLTRDIYYKKEYENNIASLRNFSDDDTFLDEYDLDDEIEIIEEQEEIDIQDINNRLKRLENMVDRFEYIEKRVETIDSQSGIFRYC